MTGIVRVAVTTGLLLTLAVTLRIIVGIIAEVIRESVNPAQCTCHRCRARRGAW